MLIIVGLVAACRRLAAVRLPPAHRQDAVYFQLQLYGK